MDVISRNSFSSSLNPNAPMFVPSAYRAVEDFSDQWWSLVNSSPWFRDYWLQERFQDPQTENDDHHLLPDLDALFESSQEEEEEEEHGVESDCVLDLVTLGSLKWRKSRVVEKPRFIEKAPKHVKVKASPRCIQQPR